MTIVSGVPENQQDRNPSSSTPRAGGADSMPGTNSNLTAATEGKTPSDALIEVFLQLQRSAKSGTLRLQAGDGRVKYVYFNRGVVELLKTTRSRTLLGRALLKHRKLTDAQLEAALERQRAGKNQLRLGQILVGMGIVAESDLQKALRFQIAEEVLELFTWPAIKTEFIRGDPPIDVFDQEDLQSRVAIKPESLTLEAQRRAQELEAIRRTIPSWNDVYVPVGDAAQRYDRKTDAGAERAVIACCDGRRDVDEIIEDVYANDLNALRALAKLVVAGDIQALPPGELIAIGQEHEERREYSRARKRYLRAEELGHPDFDLPRRIGQIDEALEDLPGACRRYVAYADRCALAGYPDVAIATLSRVLELTPADREARTKLAQVYEKSDRAEEAAAEYEKLLRSLPASATPEEKIRALQALLSVQPERSELREELAELFIQTGDPQAAIIELQDVAANALASDDPKKAIVHLRKILELDPHEILTHQQLAMTLAKAGEPRAAVEEFLKIAHQLQETGLASASAQTLVQIYEKVVELDPENEQARRWLVQAYEGKAQADKAIAHYTSLASSLRKAGKKEELCQALDKLCSYSPDDRTLALERARLKKELGKSDEATRAFKALADSAQKAKEPELATSALGEVVAAVPGDLDAQLALAKLEAQAQAPAPAEAKDKEATAPARAGRRFAAVFELAFVSGQLDLAEDAVKRAIDHEPDSALQRERYARLQLARGRADEAARSLVKAAKLARADDDHGFARVWLKRALELEPQNDEAREALESLKRAAAPVAPALVAPVAAPDASVAAAAPVAPAPVVPAVPAPPRFEPTRSGGQKLMPTITGGAKGGIQLQGHATKRVSGIADRLKELKGGGPTGDTPPEGMPRSDVYQPPEEAADTGKKARSAMDKLRAMKGGSPGTSRPSPAATPAPGPGESAAAPAPAPAGEPPAGTPGSKNTQADPVIAKKASSAMERLKALKMGGPSAAKAPASAGTQATPVGESGAAQAPAAAGPAPAGTPGSANTVAAPELAKKASSAMAKLRALKGGGPAPASSGASPAPVPASAPPGASPSPAADESFAEPAPATPEAGSPPPPPPPPPAPSTSTPAPSTSAPAPSTSAPAPSTGAPAPKTAAGPKSAAAAALPAGTPGSANTMAAENVAKKASSAMERLKALKGGGIPTASAKAPVPASAPAAASTPGASTSAASTPASSASAPATASTSAASTSAASTPAPGGAAARPASAASAALPAGTPGSANTMAAENVAKKASSAMERLKALKAGGGAAPGGGPPGGAPGAGPNTVDAGAVKVSKGPEAPGEAIDPALAKKAASAKERLRALRAGGVAPKPAPSAAGEPGAPANGSASPSDAPGAAEAAVTGGAEGGESADAASGAGGASSAP